MTVPSSVAAVTPGNMNARLIAVKTAFTEFVDLCDTDGVIANNQLSSSTVPSGQTEVLAYLTALRQAFNAMVLALLRSVYFTPNDWSAAGVVLPPNQFMPLSMSYDESPSKSLDVALAAVGIEWDDGETSYTYPATVYSGYYYPGVTTPSAIRVGQAAAIAAPYLQYLLPYLATIVGFSPDPDV